VFKKLTKNLTFWVFAGGVLGYIAALVGGDPGWASDPARPAFFAFILLVKTTFLALLRMLVAPVIFFSLIGGLLSIGDAHRLKTLGGVTMLYYLGTTIVAICIGLTVVFFIHPWVGTVERLTIEALAGDPFGAMPQFIDTGTGSIIRVLTNLLAAAFTNPFAALAELNILGIATNAFILGLALLLAVPQDSPLITGVHHINRLLHKVLSWVILITPLGIFAILFDVTLKSGGSLMNSLLGFSAVVVGGTLLHGLVVLPLIARYLGGVGPLEFFRKAAKPLMVAFATASSAATLPVSMQVCEDELGVSKTVSGFVFPLGATMNMDGTARYEGIAAVFLAYLLGVDLG